MKTIQFLFAVLFISASAVAQIQKGSNFLHGGISGQYNRNETTNNITNLSNENTYSYWYINIGYGHYVSNRFALGINAGFSMSESDYSYSNLGGNESKSEGTLYSVSPFVRNSKSISDKLYCFIQLNVGYATGPIKSSNTYLGSTDFTESTLTVIGGGFTGGLSYFLNDRFALQLAYGDLSYDISTIEIDKSSTGQDITDTDDNLTLNLGLSSLNIGLQYFIHCSKEKK